jgi:TonB family protein
MKSLATVLLLVGAMLGQGVPEQKPKHRITVAHFESVKYPAIAQQARIEGSVKIKLEFAGDGTLKNTSIISGHPMLVNTALDAAKKWKFVCFDCDYNEPFEHIFTVNFAILLGSPPTFAYSFPDVLNVYAQPVKVETTTTYKASD